MLLIYSAEDLSRLAARQIKAEMMGNSSLAQKLKQELDEIKNCKKYLDNRRSYSLKRMRDDLAENFKEFQLSSECKKWCDEDKDTDIAIHHHKFIAAQKKCDYCLKEPRMKNNLIIDIGEQVYLCLPNYQMVTEGHCLIVPKAHVSSFRTLDEDVWREVSIFKSHLRNLFRSKKKSLIFLETSMNFKYHPHAVLECIPVPEEEGDVAPLYFKKAIQESEEEWADNKKLIVLEKKCLRYSVPKNLPYFHVEFDPKVHAGYAHVIEEEKCFPRNFGKEIVGGMLGIDYNHLYKNKKEDLLKKSKEVVEFKRMWKIFKENC